MRARASASSASSRALRSSASTLSAARAAFLASRAAPSPAEAEDDDDDEDDEARLLFFSFFLRFSFFFFFFLLAFFSPLSRFRASSASMAPVARLAEALAEELRKRRSEKMPFVQIHVAAQGLPQRGHPAGGGRGRHQGHDERASRQPPGARGAERRRR